MLGEFLCILSLLSAYAVNYMDEESDRREKIFKDKNEEKGQVEEEKEKFKFSDIKKLSLTYHILNINCFFGYGVKYIT